MSSLSSSIDLDNLTSANDKNFQGDDVNADEHGGIRKKLPVTILSGNHWEQRRFLNIDYILVMDPCRFSGRREDHTASACAPKQSLWPSICGDCK